MRRIKILRITAPGLVLVAMCLAVLANATTPLPAGMIAIWGNGYNATLGGSLAPGLWMLGGAERLLERARRGVLFADLTACNNYAGALAAAGKVTVPTILILGSRDVMTPAKSGKALAAAISGSRITVLEGAGHLLMSERPEEVFAALRS